MLIIYAKFATAMPRTIDLIEKVLARLLYELEHLELLPFSNDGNNLQYSLVTCGKKIKIIKILVN